MNIFKSIRYPIMFLKNRILVSKPIIEKLSSTNIEPEDEIDIELIEKHLEDIEKHITHSIQQNRSTHPHVKHNA